MSFRRVFLVMLAGAAVPVVALAGGGELGDPCDPAQEGQCRVKCDKRVNVCVIPCSNASADWTPCPEGFKCADGWYDEVRSGSPVCVRQEQFEVIARLRKEARAARKLRLAEEARKEEEASAARAARLRDPKWQRPAISASICAYAKIRADSVKEIADEKRYAAEGGGVQDLRRIHDAQDRMRIMDRAAAIKRKQASQMKVVPLPCSDKLVRALMSCAPEWEQAGNERPEACQAPPLSDYVGLISHFTDDL